MAMEAHAAAAHAGSVTAGRGQRHRATMLQAVLAMVHERGGSLGHGHTVGMQSDRWAITATPPHSCRGGLASRFICTQLPAIQAHLYPTPQTHTRTRILPPEANQRSHFPFTAPKSIHRFPNTPLHVCRVVKLYRLEAGWREARRRCLGSPVPPAIAVQPQHGGRRASATGAAAAAAVPAHEAAPQQMLAVKQEKHAEGQQLPVMAAEAAPMSGARSRQRSSKSKASGSKPRMLLQRCGTCESCLNPAKKKGCLTLRAMAAGMQVRSCAPLLPPSSAHIMPTWHLDRHTLV